MYNFYFFVLLFKKLRVMPTQIRCRRPAGRWKRVGLRTYIYVQVFSSSSTEISSAETSQRDNREKGTWTANRSGQLFGLHVISGSFTFLRAGLETLSLSLFHKVFIHVVTRLVEDDRNDSEKEEEEEEEKKEKKISLKLLHLAILLLFFSSLSRFLLLDLLLLFCYFSSRLCLLFCPKRCRLCGVWWWKTSATTPSSLLFIHISLSPGMIAQYNRDRDDLYIYIEGGTGPYATMMCHTQKKNPPLDMHMKRCCAPKS